MEHVAGQGRERPEARWLGGHMTRHGSVRELNGFGLMVMPQRMRSVTGRERKSDVGQRFRTKKWVGHSSCLMSMCLMPWFSIELVPTDLLILICL